MNSKSKTALSVILLMMVIAATAMIAMVFVWAANQQKFSSSIMVKFEAVRVNGQASARWKVGSEKWQNMTAGGDVNGATILTFGQENNEGFSLSPTDKNIELTFQNDYVVFEYKFTNTGNYDYAIDLFYTDDETEDNNISVFCMNSDNEISSNFKENIGTPYEDWTTTRISAYGTKYIYILASVTDTGKDAGHSGSFQFSLDGKDYSSDLEFDGTGTITDLKTNNLPVVHIPDEINGVAVKKITASAFADNATLTELTIPDSVEEIERGALNSGCSGLKYILIPFIGNSRTATSTVQKCFGYIFGARSEYEVNSSLPTSLTHVIVTGGTTIGDNAFYACENLKSIIIPNGVTSIGTMAFEWCSGLTTITIPSSVLTIGDEAFNYCGGLTNIIIPNSVTNIGFGAFKHCSGLTGNLIIPNSVTNVGIEAFMYCSGLTDLTILNGYIYDTAFSDCSSLKSVTIGAGVTGIEQFAFDGCSNLTEVTIESSYAYRNAIGTDANFNVGGLVTYATTVKVLSSIVVDGHKYINNTNFPNVTTESVGGKVYTVYKK